MISAAIDPKSSRGFLKKRLFESRVVLAVIFLGLVTVFAAISAHYFASFLPMLFADVVAGLVAYYVYLVWNKQPVRIRCDDCDGVILWNTPWICGECDHENRDVANFPFLYECASCHHAPKSYKCHHCGEPIFLSEDEDATNQAQRAVAQGRETKKRSEKREKVEQVFEEKKQNIESVKLDVEEAELKAKLKTIKTGVPPVSIQSELEVQYNRLRIHMDVKTAIREAVRRQKESNAKDCKNDPQERRRRDLEADEFARHQMLGEL